MKKACRICTHYDSSTGTKDLLEWQELANPSPHFTGDGLCNRHTGIKDNSNALAICSSEGILGEFIVKENFYCKDYKYDRSVKKRRELEDKEYQKYLSYGPFSFKQKEIDEELNRIREGMRNQEYIKPKYFSFLPKGINSITDYLTEEEKKIMRELEVKQRIKDAQNEKK